METAPHDRGRHRHGEETRKRQRETEIRMKRNPGGEIWKRQ